MGIALAVTDVLLLAALATAVLLGAGGLVRRLRGKPAAPAQAERQPNNWLLLAGASLIAVGLAVLLLAALDGR